MTQTYRYLAREQYVGFERNASDFGSTTDRLSPAVGASRRSDRDIFVLMGVPCPTQIREVTEAHNQTQETIYT